MERYCARPVIAMLICTVILSLDYQGLRNSGWSHKPNASCNYVTNITQTSWQTFKRRTYFYCPCIAIALGWLCGAFFMVWLITNGMVRLQMQGCCCRGADLWGPLCWLSCGCTGSRADSARKNVSLNWKAVYTDTSWRRWYEVVWREFRTSRRASEYVDQRGWCK